MHENRHYPIYGVRCNTPVRWRPPRAAIMIYLRLEVGRDWKFIARYRKLLIESMRQAGARGERTICRPFTDAAIYRTGV